MGSVFRQQVTRAVPTEAEVFEKGGERFARWRVRGKLRTAKLTTGTDGTPRIVTESKTYSARFRDATGKVVTRSTGCRDEQTARQKLSKWEREVEQIGAGVLDAKSLDTARNSSAPLETHLSVYERSLVAAGVSDVYRANVLRAVRRVARECEFSTLASVSREAVEQWLADRIADGMGARSRNYYRESLIAFANWCVDNGRLREHDFDRLPKADAKADPKRQRRALTEDELTRVLVVASARPVIDARTVRRGKRKGEQFAELRPETVARLQRAGRERALIYKTLVLTGLRANELRTLTVGRLTLTLGAECLQLEAKNEKNRDGSTLPLRSDLADDLRTWIVERGLSAADRLFTVPKGLRLILDRDLRAAGIPKRDDRGRTVDVHAIRTTFGTLLSTTGTAPRIAQQAMRHSDIKLTMSVYTDPRLLDVRGAMEKLPTFPLPSLVTLPVTLTPDKPGPFGSPTGTSAPSNDLASGAGKLAVSACPVNENAPVTTAVITGASVGATEHQLNSSWLA